MQSLLYARSIAKRVIAVHVAIDEEEAHQLCKTWEGWTAQMGAEEGLEQIIIESPYRSLHAPLLAHIDTVHELYADRTLTVLLPEFVVKLTPTEYDLLKALISNRGKILTRQMLLSQVWGSGYGADAHYLHVYIGQLRHKIEPDPAHPRFILTISGVGYRFNGED
ncbi:MAG: winged helix-turn-helix domain-containing protein [Ktedonobacteraceae bacterium]